VIVKTLASKSESVRVRGAKKSKVLFVVNLKTAKTLGITIPLPLSGRADGLIE
jgi:hypothetical protein